MTLTFEVFDPKYIHTKRLTVINFRSNFDGFWNKYGLDVNFNCVDPLGASPRLVSR